MVNLSDKKIDGIEAFGEGGTYFNEDDVRNAVRKLLEETHCQGCNKWLKLCGCANSSPVISTNIFNEIFGKELTQ